MLHAVVPGAVFVAPVRAFGPPWSPDGSKIAFMDTQFGRHWTVSPIASSRGLLQSLPGVDANWTPDGRSIVYTTLSNPDAKVPFAGISRLDLDSGKTRSIPNSEARSSSRVSPDGRYIAAFSEAATELQLFDSKTQQWSTLAKSELLSFNLWSHDGKYVYVRDNPGSPRIVRVHIPDGRMEEVVSLRGFPQVGDSFAGWLGLTPGNEPVVIRDRSFFPSPLEAALYSVGRSSPNNLPHNTQEVLPHDLLDVCFAVATS